MDGCAWTMLLDRDHAGSELQRVLGTHCIGWAERPKGVLVCVMDVAQKILGINLDMC